MEFEIVLSVLKDLPVYIRATNPRSLGQISPFHIHDEVELLRVTQGAFLFKTSEHTYELKAGDFIFIQSRTPHYTESLEDGSDSQLILFRYELFAEDPLPDACRYLSRFFTTEKALSAVFRADTPEAGEMSRIFEAVLREMQEQRPAYGLYIKSQILAIVAFLSRYNVMPDPSALRNEHDVKKILPALEYVEANYSRNISLEEVCTVLNLNVSYFCRLFKKATGSSFLEYLNFVRICKTESMLAASGKGIAEIALDVGFASASYFNKIFRRYKGCTPSEYKKSLYQKEVTAM